MTERISSELQISAYMHCRRCLKELPDGESPQSYAQLEVGFTTIGLQVWCKRHNVNVVHIDFQGQKHPANMSCDEVETAQ